MDTEERPFYNSLHIVHNHCMTRTTIYYNVVVASSTTCANPWLLSSSAATTRHITHPCGTAEASKDSMSQQSASIVLHSIK